jgi:hypothetical protein
MMTGAFQYRPKFVDIRASKGKSAKAGKSSKSGKPEVSEDVRPCDHVDCKLPGEHRAPKSRDRQNEFWHFCREHVTEYNRRWNYFSGMSDEELAAFQRAEETGHRPTWSMRASRNDRLSAAMRGFQAGRRSDPFDMFSGGAAPTRAAKAPKRRLTRMQVLALEVLQLGEDATGEAIRTRYAELVKRWHPDSNGGDRSAEAQLQRVIKSYQLLKGAGLAG